MSAPRQMPWRCPLCGAPLTGQSPLRCAAGHSFDRAKEGYWHLLPVQQMRTKAPGDSKEMVAARRSFLEGGYYAPLGESLAQVCLRGDSLPRQMRRCACWMQAAARDGTTGVLRRPLHRQTAPWSWRGSTLQSPLYGWRLKPYPRVCMRWPPALPSR